MRSRGTLKEDSGTHDQGIEDKQGIEDGVNLIGQSSDSLREAFGRALTGLADQYPNVVVLDGDVAGGTGMHHFRNAYPDRFLAVNRLSSECKWQHQTLLDGSVKTSFASSG